jgi:hypothetical protein
METNLDKQTDRIMRSLAVAERAAPDSGSSHVDADELSAFVEDVLPVKARERITLHLSDCRRCRQIFVQLSSLSIAAESESIHEETRPLTALIPVPWYQKLFAFPQISYVMGAMAIVVTGMVALLIYNSGSGETQVARVEPENNTVSRPASSVGADSEGEVVERPASNVAANAAIPAANVAVLANSAATPISPVRREKDSAEAKSVSAESPVSGAGPVDDSLKGGRESTVPKKNAEIPTPEYEKGDRGRIQESNTVELAGQSRQNNVMTPDTNSGRGVNQVSAPAPGVTASRDEPSEVTRGGETIVPSKKQAAKPAPSVMKLGSKQFANANGVWTDSEYKGGATKNVKRGSYEFKKLDSDLQNIGTSLRGTVIVVWKGQNYKIQ